MKAALLITGLLLVLPARAEDLYRVMLSLDGAETSHLVPVNSRMDAYMDAYEERLARHLFVTDGRLGRFVCRPSFRPESCVSVDAEIAGDAKEQRRGGRDEDKRYVVTLTEAADSLWYSMAGNNQENRTREVKVLRTDRDISMELAVAVQRAWGRMLHLTRYPAKSSLGLDGTTYEFSVWVDSLGWLQGRTWSPETGLTAEMVKLGEALKDFAKRKDGDEKALLKRLRAFERTIPEA